MRTEIASFALLNLDTAVLRSCEPAFLFFIVSLHLECWGRCMADMPSATEQSCLLVTVGSGLLRE
jgi:hypothetical protein